MKVEKVEVDVEVEMEMEEVDAELLAAVSLCSHTSCFRLLVCVSIHQQHLSLLRLLPPVTLSIPASCCSF